MSEVDQQQVYSSEAALQRAVWDSNELLVSASTVFTLFPTKIWMNRSKLVIEKRSALGSIDVMSFRIEDVLSVSGSGGPIFGTIKIVTRFMKLGDSQSIGLFTRKDTLQLKRLIQGMILAIQKNINVGIIPTAELKTLLYQLGEDDHSIQ